MASQQQQQHGSKNKEDMLHEVSISRNEDCTKKLDHYITIIVSEFIKWSSFFWSNVDNFVKSDQTTERENPWSRV